MKFIRHFETIIDNFCVILIFHIIIIKNVFLTMYQNKHFVTNFYQSTPHLNGFSFSFSSLWNAGLQRCLSTCTRCTMPFWRIERLCRPFFPLHICPFLPNQPPPPLWHKIQLSNVCCHYFKSIYRYQFMYPLCENHTCSILAKCLDVVDSVEWEFWNTAIYIF